MLSLSAEEIEMQNILLVLASPNQFGTTPWRMSSALSINVITASLFPFHPLPRAGH